MIRLSGVCFVYRRIFLLTSCLARICSVLSSPGVPVEHCILLLRSICRVKLKTYTCYSTLREKVQYIRWCRGVGEITRLKAPGREGGGRERGKEGERKGGTPRLNPRIMYREVFATVTAWQLRHG